MSHTTEAAAPESPLDRIGLGWMEDMPKGAWIALMVIGFILFWPLGLAILGYMIWSGKIMRGWRNHSHYCGRSGTSRHSRPTGNTAFDDYRAETLKRLEEEQEAFQSFLDRLRRAKDREEFEAFINERKGQQPEGGTAV